MTATDTPRLSPEAAASRARQEALMHAKPPINTPDQIVQVLVGADGMLAYCCACDRSVTPWTHLHGRVRATTQAALADRLIHMRDVHGEPFPSERTTR